jgi:hypothetical protein
MLVDYWCVRNVSEKLAFDANSFIDPVTPRETRAGQSRSNRNSRRIMPEESCARSEAGAA